MLHTQFVKRLRKLKKCLMTKEASSPKLKTAENLEYQKALSIRYGSNTVETLDRTEQRFLNHITTVLDRLEDNIDVVYDIGANRGFWAEAFSLYTGTNVYAFEPLPSMVTELRKREERFPLIQVQPVACGNEQSKRFMYEEEYKVEASSILEITELSKCEFAQSKVGQSHSEEVEVVRLDEWVRKQNLPSPTLIKIDVQGYEIQVLEGGRAILEHTKYVWIELNFKQLYVGGSTFETVYAVLHELGFQLVDCIELVRSKRNDQLIYMDGMF